jgi:hypothetical protein
MYEIAVAAETRNIAGVDDVLNIRGAGHVLVGQRVEETVSNGERAIDADCFLRALRDVSPPTMTG